MAPLSFTCAASGLTKNGQEVIPRLKISNIHYRLVSHFFFAMRTFLSLLFSLQFLATLGTLSEAFSNISFARANPLPVLLALIALILLLVIVFCMMYGGVSQATGEKLSEPKPDNAHGGWWNLGRCDMLIIVLLLSGIFSYGTTFAQISFYMMPEMHMRYSITIADLPLVVLTNSCYWLGAFGAVFLACILLRLCNKWQPSSKAVAVIVALVSLLALFFIAGSLYAVTSSRDWLAKASLQSPGSIFACVSVICCYKVMRCVSLRCLLPSWAGGWHEGGIAPTPNDDNTSEKIVDKEQASALSPSPKAPQQASATTSHLTSKRAYYAILALWAVGAGAVMARWAEDELRGFNQDEALIYGILFGISFLFFGNFVYDAMRKAFRQYYADRAEKALPYAVLSILALGVWYVLFLGLARIIN